MNKEIYNMKLTNEVIWLKLFDTLSENQKRWFAAQRALEFGRGGITAINELTGMSRTTITKGINEIQKKKVLNNDKARSKGAGRKAIKDSNMPLLVELENIMEENTSGDPMRVLKWTCKSTRNIADELSKKGFTVSYKTVYNLLSEQDYTLQGNKKTLGNCNSAERDAQFHYINSQVKKYIRTKDPVISVDTKKKELVGNFKNAGRTWQKKGEGRNVNDHDFSSLGSGVAIPYGAYDIKRNEGFVNVGITSDTAEFAINSIKQWWLLMGKKNYPNSKRLLICADGGGSNGSRNKIWKTNLQKLSNELGIHITVCHYPPGTSKWNKIEHKMFSYISMNWKGIPLESYEMIVNLIGATKTKKGLKIQATLDSNVYQKGLKVTDEDYEMINLKLHKTHPNWNYTIKFDN